MRRAVREKNLDPANIELEEAFIGSLLVDPIQIREVKEVLEPGELYIERFKWIYQGMLELYQADGRFDLMTLTDWLDRKGRLSELGEYQLTQAFTNYSHTLTDRASIYAKRLAAIAYYRRLAVAATEIANIGFNEPDLDPKEAHRKAQKILTKARGWRQSDIHAKPIATSMVNYLDNLDRVIAGDVVPGKSTGLPDVDKLLAGGMYDGDLILLAGRPGMGKTALALQIMLHRAREHGRILAYSLEMSDQQLVERMLSAKLRIQTLNIRRGEVEDWVTFNQTTHELASQKIWIDDRPGIEIEEVCDQARWMHEIEPLDIMVIDYLQLARGIPGESDSRQQEVSSISRALKNLARELNIPILALSQLSRKLEDRRDKRPQLADLRESGSLEQDADVVMFIYRDDVYFPRTSTPNITDIIVSKYRHGPTGVASLFYRKAFNIFVGLELRAAPLVPQQLAYKEPE